MCVGGTRLLSASALVRMSRAEESWLLSKRPHTSVLTALSTSPSGSSMVSVCVDGWSSSSGVSAILGDFLDKGTFKGERRAARIG